MSGACLGVGAGEEPLGDGADRSFRGDEQQPRSLRRHRGLQLHFVCVSASLTFSACVGPPLLACLFGSKRQVRDSHTQIDKAALERCMIMVSVIRGVSLSLMLVRREHCGRGRRPS